MDVKLYKAKYIKAIKNIKTKYDCEKIFNEWVYAIYGTYKNPSGYKSFLEAINKIIKTVYANSTIKVLAESTAVFQFIIGELKNLITKHEEAIRHFNESISINPYLSNPAYIRKIIVQLFSLYDSKDDTSDLEQEILESLQKLEIFYEGEYSKCLDIKKQIQTNEEAMTCLLSLNLDHIPLLYEQLLYGFYYLYRYKGELSQILDYTKKIYEINKDNNILIDIVYLNSTLGIENNDTKRYRDLLGNIHQQLAILNLPFDYMIRYISTGIYSIDTSFYSGEQTHSLKNVPLQKSARSIQKLETYYQYKSVHSALRSIATNSIYLSNPNDFNDATDPFHRLLSDEKLRDSCKKFMNNFGIACLSERHDSQLMWSHYADKHRGVCIKYVVHDLPFYIALDKVKYEEDQIYQKSNYIHLNNFKGNFINFIDMLYFKSKDWKYEKEVRMIKYVENEAERKLVSGKYMVKNSINETIEFDFNIKIAEVYLGKEINGDDEQLIRELCASKSNIKVYKMKVKDDNLWKLEKY